MIRFIHTADIHFGMENYGRIDHKTGIHSRLLDFEKSLNTCIDYAIEQNVDFFMFSGDAYKTATPSPTQQKLLMRCFMKLYAAKIPLVIVVGNHDNPLSFGKANSLDIFGSLPLDGFHVFAKPDTLLLQTKSGPIQIVGIPWPNRHNIALKEDYFVQSATDITEQISQALAQIITKLAGQLDPTIPAILAGHLTVSNGIFSGSERKAIYGQDPILMPSQLAIKPFDYVALGHLHRFQNLNEAGIPIVYSGSIDRIDFGERKEEKGFCVVSINKKKECSFEFITIPTRPFIQIDVELDKESDQTSQILAAIQRHKITDAIVKITYKLPVTAIDDVDIKKIQLACSYSMYLVGIIPIRDLPTRSYRSILSSEMDLQTLLKNFFDSKENLKDRSQNLIEKTLLLQNEVDLEKNDTCD
ncbi:exonuclease SbcCD subunit D [Candidatus Babeliales bacterium]|nr:exonuclease SbcCD subunit D [Candidatus Babeliales bacterium]MBP9843313.1 exonuclease SbcCD subunit D [Candidatus Babeliales bacterium]